MNGAWDSAREGRVHGGSLSLLEQPVEKEVFWVEFGNGARRDAASGYEPVAGKFWRSGSGCQSSCDAGCLSSPRLGSFSGAAVRCKPCELPRAVCRPMPSRPPVPSLTCPAASRLLFVSRWCYCPLQWVPANGLLSERLVISLVFSVLHGQNCMAFHTILELSPRKSCFLVKISHETHGSYQNLSKQSLKREFSVRYSFSLKSADRNMLLTRKSRLTLVESTITKQSHPSGKETVFS